MKDNKEKTNVREKNRLKRIIKRFFTKQDFKKLSKDFFDMKASVYDKEELELYSEDSCEAVFNELKKIKYNSLLDVGCGTGHLLSLLPKNKKSKYVGLDISPKMIDEAKKKIIKNTEFVVGSADDLPFKDKSFDVVTCSESAHHYLDLDKTIKEVYRILKDNGYYIIADKDVGHFIWYHNFFNRKFKNTGDCNFSNLKKTKRLIKKNNFEIIYAGKYYNDTHYIIVGRK